MKKLILSGSVLFLFILSLGACGTQEEAYFMKGGNDGMEVSPAGEIIIPAQEEESPVAPVEGLQPHEPTLPSQPAFSEIKVEIQTAMGSFRPGLYTFGPAITGGVAPLEAEWSCTSPDSKCPELFLQGHPSGFPELTGEFLEGQYQIDLSVLDAEGNKGSASYIFEIVSGTSTPSLQLQDNYPENLEGDLDLEDEPTFEFNGF